MLLCLLSLAGFSQNRTIQGRVTDSATHTPLAGVFITLEGTAIQTTTDTAGRYSLTFPAGDRSLIFAFIGYKSVGVRIGQRAVVNVILSPDWRVLNEVVVVGYATQMKQSVTGAISKIPGARNTYLQPFQTEDYAAIAENGFRDARHTPVSTFSVDVDRASYANIRRFLNLGQLPPKDAVRLEEMVNYFEYDHQPPTGSDPVAVTTELSESPWNKGLQLLRIGLQARTIPADNLPPSNLVFLIDVSGSMESENKLPLVKASLNLLVDQLRPQDRVAIVVYAGAAGLVLPSTPGNQRQTIKNALEGLQAGGSTAGGEGIRLAYDVALNNFQKGGNNRVVLATDGDFNVGVSSDAELQRLIESKRQSGVFLSVLGFGMGNYKDNKLETLADKGAGNYAYIDQLPEAQKVFVKEFGGTLFTVAKDVKLQLEFNPALVQAYRLIGYENRLLNNEDFRDDRKDAGEMGSGHTVTALYEIIPVGVKSAYLPRLDSLKYQRQLAKGRDQRDLLTLKIRYKPLESDTSRLIEYTVSSQAKKPAQTSDDFRFTAAVAEFGLLLRQSEWKGAARYEQVTDLARHALGPDAEGYRREFIRLVEVAQSLTNTTVMAEKEKEK